MAQETQMRGCRRGYHRPVSAMTRGQVASRVPGGDYYHGERHQLVALVSFADKAFQGSESETMAQWNKIFNAVDMQESPFKGSVHDYFYDQSYRQLNLQFDLYYVQLADKVVKYRSWDSKYDDPVPDDENSQYLVNEIMDQLEKRDIDWSRYDWNGDGYVNQLLIVYAGKGMNDGGGKNSIWPHQWWLSAHRKDRQEDVYCEPRSVSYDNKNYLIDCYCALPELDGIGSYGSFGTLIHEFTHCFGFPDFYYNGSSYVGNWDLMDRGNYNGGGYLPPGYSAHERWLMGWLKPTELTSNFSTNTMPALADEGVAYLIRNDGYGDEFYMVENRQQTSWDASLPGSGIVVFHIDYDPAVWTGITSWPNSNNRKRYVMIPANNKTTYTDSNAKNWAYPYGANNQLTNTSSPAATLWHENTDGSMLMNKSLTEMNVSGEGLASFSFSTTTTGIVDHHNASSPSVLYEYGPIRIVRTSNGIIKKVMKR